MVSYSTSEAARRLSAIIAEAERAPVVIDNHGKPRAALVSMRRFHLYEALLQKELEAMAAEAPIAADGAGDDAKPGMAARRRLKARPSAGGGA